MHIYNYIQDQIKPYEKTLKSEEKPKWVTDEIVLNYFNHMAETLKFIEKLEEDEYLILRI